jgi:ankyrin repeat protein
VEALSADAGAVQPVDGRSALHWAARNGHAEVCRWLVVGCGLDPSR